MRLLLNGTRWIRGGLLAATLAVPLFAQTTQRTIPDITPASWRQLRNGIDNVGVMRGGLDANWYFKSSLPVRAISVASGIVLLGAESADAETNTPRGDERGLLTALDAATGRVLWSHPMPTWIHSDALIYGGRVYATCGRWPMTHPGGLLAMDARTGRLAWSVQEPAGMMPGAAIDSAAGSIVAAGGDGLVLALSLKDGSVIRSTGLGSADGMSSVRIDDDGVAFLGAANSLESYSTRTGVINWIFKPGGMKAFGDVPVAISDDIVFTTGTQNYGFRNAFRALPISRFASLSKEALSRERVHSYRGWFHQQTLVALDRATGRVKWRHPLGVGLSVPRNQSGTPVVVGDRVLVSSPVSKMLWAFNKSTGDVLWSRQLDAMHKGAVTVTGEDVVLGDKNGTVSILRLGDGAVVGKCKAGGSFSVTAPVIVGKTLLVALRDGATWATPYDSLRSRAVRGVSCFEKRTASAPAAKRAN